jgi:hypothetical protein
VAGEPRRVMEPAVEAGGGEDGIAQPRRPCRARVVPGDPAAAARISATAAGEEVMGLPPLAWERAARSQDAPGRVQRGLQLGLERMARRGGLERLDHRLPGRAGAGQAPRAGREGPGHRPRGRAGARGPPDHGRRLRFDTPPRGQRRGRGGSERAAPRA